MIKFLQKTGSSLCKNTAIAFAKVFWNYDIGPRLGEFAPF
jgi:hypothetical protein